MAVPLTFLFTDLENSTSLWQQAPAEMRKALARHDSILRSAVESHNGRVVKTTGDGLHAVFASPADALLAAISGQRAVSATDWPAETGPLKVRMGLHTGESEARDGDYFGSTVNQAARIMGLSYGGQILLSEATAAILRNQTPSGVVFIDLGAHWLKGLEQPEVIYQLSHPDLSADFPPLQSPSVPRHNLPIQPTSFIGRNKEVDEIMQLLSDEPGCRLLTLVGPGGIGKTRLALEAASQLDTLFDDGAWFVSLAPVGEVKYIVPAIAEALAFSFQGETDPRFQLLHHLKQKNYLLVLDNFEHLLSGHSPPDADWGQGGEALLSELLNAVPHLKILVTSRERLNLQEEWRFDVLGMPFPGDLKNLDADADRPENYAAIQLFLQRARKADASFTYSPEDLISIIRICRLVEGLPLGIELAAAWVRSMSCREIADELEKSFDLLATSLQNIPERHRSMRAILEQTWRQLSMEERLILTKLSVFRGGCLREAAEFVSGATPRQLASLVEKALLGRNRSGRYDLHELVRQFSQEQLQGTHEVYAQTIIQHYRYYTTFVEKQLEDLKGGAQTEALQRITADIDNVRAAWQRAIDARDSLALERAAECLYFYYELEGALAEGGTAFRQAVEAFDPAKIEIAPNEIRLRGFLLVGQGSLYAHRGDLNEGRALLEQGLALLESNSTDNRQQQRQALALMRLGWVYFLLAENETAQQLIRDSLTLYREINDRWGVAKCLYILGNSLTGSGLLAEAEAPLRQSLAICEQIEDRRSQLLVEWNLAILTFWFGDYEQTDQLLTHAAVLGEELDDKIGLALILKELGKLEVVRGEYNQAVRTLQSSIAITDEIGSLWESAATLDDLGVAFCLIGDYTAAESALRQCLEASQTRKHRYFTARCWGDLGLLAYRKGRYPEAEEHLQKAQNIWEILGHEPYQGWVLCQMGHTQQALGEKRYADAIKNYRQALQLSVKHRLVPFAMEVFVGVARLMKEVDAHDTALDLLTQAVAHPASTADVRKRARKHLADLGFDQWSEGENALYSRQSAEWQTAAIGLIETLAASSLSQDDRS